MVGKKISEYKGRLGEPMYDEDYFKQPGLLVEKSDEEARKEAEAFLGNLMNALICSFPIGTSTEQIGNHLL